ncbi:MAG TPA: glycosyltransferase family 4 protein [Verrucomicrobiae bacterium]|jgi:UDP-glucose:(heptosyl)LPS alpha-1,3-glucosyltransferase
MKLALIRRQFSATGGAELYLQRLMRSLAEQNHELHLFTESWTETPANVKLHPIKISATRANRGLEFAEAVQNELAKEKFDCVFSLERTLRQDVYRAGDGVHRVWLERRKQFVPFWKKSFTGLGVFHKNMTALETQTFNPQNTRRIIVNSEMVKHEILEHFRFPAERIHLVRNGVNVARFQKGERAETRARFGVKDDEFLLLFVGSGWERKGLKFVLAAFEKISGAGFQPAGRQDACPTKIKLLVVGKGRKPLFISPGVIFSEPANDLENFYAAADLFVFPPIYEPSANVVFEALAAGLPVVTSANNGAAEIILENVTGSVVKEFWRPEILAATIKIWMEHPRGVQINAAEFSLERNVSETLAILEQAAKEKVK